MKRTEGFTLIEVMVATVILLLMTVMMGALFRQASSAWDAGNAEAEGGMIVRGVVGAITRDMATAIDGRAYGGASFTCSGSKLEFVCLKPTVRNGVTNREPHKITYQGGSGKVSRHDRILDNSGKNWVDNGDQPSIIYNGDATGYGARFTFEAINLPPKNKTNPSGSASVRSGSDYEGLAGSGAYIWNGPASVKVTLSLTQDGSFSGLSVRSWGRNGRKSEDEDPKTVSDDIVVK